MGFFGDLMGGSQRDDVRAANRGANGLLRRGMRDAQDSINTGITQQLDALGRGNTGAVQALNQGYGTARNDIVNASVGQLGSLASGNAAARGALTQGYNTARGDVARGAAGAENAINQHQAYIQQTLNPFVQSGRGAQNLYDNALGVNGQAAASAFFNQYGANDPFRQFNEDMANKAMERSFNAAGNLGSGRAALAASRANLERGSQDLNRYLDRLSASGQQGGQYASELAGYANNAGNTIAGIRGNLGTQQANLATGQGQDLGRLAYGYGQDRGAAIANRGAQMADLATNRGQDLGRLSYGYGQDRGNIMAGRGQANAELQYGLAQQLAGNRLNLGNAVAASRGIGVNNLLGLGGLAIQGMTPGASGMSAFGNMASAFPRF